MRHLNGFALLLPLCFGACKPARSAGEVAAALREYVPRMSLFDTLGAARLKVPSLSLRVGESGNFADTAFAAPDGFAILVVRLQLPSYDVEPSSSEQVRRIELWAMSDSSAAVRAYQRLAATLHSQPDTVCVPSASGTPSSRAVYWTDAEGGVVLETPIEPRPWQARLVFFRGEWKPSESIGAIRTTACPS